MKDRRTSTERRSKSRRKLLSEKEFRKLVKEGKLSAADQRAWHERRKKKRRRKVVGI
jgi:hypothetical protein